MQDQTPPAAPPGLPTSLEVDEKGYPNEAIIEQIARANSVGTGGRWMVDVFPKLAASIPYGKCFVSNDVYVKGERWTRITFQTEGWGGCEDFVGAVVGNSALRVRYFDAEDWEPGGRYSFCVPQSDLDVTR